MMHRLCGMTTEEYAKYRRDLGLIEGRGRPTVPPEPVQESIWRAWLESAGETGEKRRYLAVQASVQVPVGTIWRLICKWESTGLTPVFSASLPKQSGAGLFQGTLETTE
ncbi:MAG: STY4526/YPO1902 family pathogenicity island replication protein [Methylococcales bacterium]